MKLIQADWPAPHHVQAFTTTRAGGVSKAPFNSLNLGDHVGDQSAAVVENRQRLIDAELSACLPPQWLQQVHGTTVVQAQADGVVPQADACWSDRTNQPCIVMTADCLPVCFTDLTGSRVAVAHAGWRGLCDGILEQTLQQFPDPNQVICWLGPAIGPLAFEVGPEVRDQFCAVQAEADIAFRAADNGKWLTDLYQLARLRLQGKGVHSVHGGGLCTLNDPSRFFSYRREQQTGRMATVIWLADS